MTELGPFHPSADGQTLVENPHSWNKAANVLFLEAPRDVGFSYRDPAYPPDTLYNDVKTATDNAIALQQFFLRFPEYQNRDFYITGESYGGVYVPTLTNLVITMIQNGSMPNVNLVGMAVGNGELSAYQQINSGINLLYYKGMIGKSQYESLLQCCYNFTNNNIPLEYCDFSSFVTIDDFGNYVPKNDSALVNQCGTMVMNYAQNSVWNTANDVYNSYQDCYNFTVIQNGMKGTPGLRTYKTIMGSKTMRAFVASSQAASVMTLQNPVGNPFVDQGALLNNFSTDALNSFPCYMDDATQTYLNRADVRQALHIPSSVQMWQDCNDDINEKYYIQQNHDMTPVFQSIINSGYKIRLLIYNGDADMACNYQGDEWFIENLAAQMNFNLVAPRQEWSYTRPGFPGIVAGFIKRWNVKNASLDLMTVKGAGHFVPTDRPAPALQMIYNFINNNNYNFSLPFSPVTQPILPAYTTPAPQPFSRKQADRVWYLPGLTYNINFKQYSGYLNGVPGNYLHYWFLESQTNPATDPLVLWLNGGPGCSSLMGLLSELGPFHPNPDGKTLYENIYSWNKGANVIFLESPRNVGFSYQNTSINPDTVYNDEKTAWDSFLALKDFFSIYPEYNGRPFYVTGESYGGVYVPTLTSLLIDQIQAGNFPQLNLVGMAVGNGELSALQQLNSAVQMGYFHGLYGKQEYDQLQQCCNRTRSTTATWMEYCDFSQYVILDDKGNALPRDNSVCAQLSVQYGQLNFWNSWNDVYNIYQDCYQQTTGGSHLASISNRRKKALYKQALVAAAFQDQGSQISDFSTDSQGGFRCFEGSAAASYLNSDDVRAALHISPAAGTWSSCNDDMNEKYYVQQHNDTGAVFDHMIQSKYPLRIMIYNGDVDQACNYLGDQWFIEAVAKRWGMAVSRNFGPWMYMSQIAGYSKQFNFVQGTIDLVTVKGAGHLVPLDRPGPALQMITNFFRSQDFSNLIPYNTQLSSLTEQYKVAQMVGQINQAGGGSASVSSKKMKKNSRVGLKQRQILKAKGLLPDDQKRAKRSAVPVAPPPTQTKEQDMIQNLPGLTFTPGFKQYSGYLNASPGNYLHYWLVESQGNPATDPLILWLNGGPGCSSIGGFLEELGPFHVNPDGQTLFENVYTWNKVGNVLFMEAPRDVGYSYRSSDVQPDSMYNDTYTANDNVLALDSFMQKFPEYKNRDFYITGESYGGVYVPTFTAALIKKIQDTSMSYVKFVGVAIGNGEMSEIQQINSAVSLTYFRGEHGKSDYDALSMCCDGNMTTQAYCDFSAYYYLDTAGNAWPKYNDGSVAAQCGQLVVQQGFNDVWMTGNDVYNTFQDCYVPTGGGGNFNTKSRRSKRSVQPLSNAQPFVNQASKINYMSTDANGGFACYNGDATQSYMNLQPVRQALHIPDGLPGWTDCNDDMNEHYVQMHNDTTSVFMDILKSGYPLRFLIYNGDADMACQFLGDEWFIERLAAQNGMTATTRTPWNYTLPGGPGYQPALAGYFKTFTYTGTGGQVTFDLLTVKGGGHFVPTDRPGPALQMINNFVNKKDYSSQLTVNLARKPLLAEYTTAPPNVYRRKADMVFNLPGLTYNLNFHHHSGYLNAAVPGNYLHYWFVESQNDSSYDPLILWLNGGPGCSSLGGLLTENGPFHVNSDGRTLFENVYSWNKAASIIYLESPRMVGFSYQDNSTNTDHTFNDDLTAADAAAALKDFFNTYPWLQNNRFYVTGESYGGVYVPTLTRLLIQQIQAKQLNANLVGMAIGNGMVSMIQDIRSLPDFMYYHGMYGKQEYDALRACCPPGSNSAVECNYDYYINIVDGGYVAKNFTNANDNNCANLVVSMTQDRNWYSGYDVYNMYQDCYLTGDNVFNLGSAPSRKQFRAEPRSDPRRQFAAQMTQFPVNTNNLDPYSTDSFGGFQCYMVSAATNYLNQVHVRNALNIPDFVQPWEFCSSNQYVQNYQVTNNDTTPVFQDILDSKYPLQVLMYNGDTDTACGMFEAEWMMENFASVNNFQVTKDRGPWYYRGQIGGYMKNFKSTTGNMQIYLGTVKGAGHMVPTDRPAPAQQMIYNFLNGSPDYNVPVAFDLTRQPLTAQFVEQGDGGSSTTPPVTMGQSTTTTTTTTTPAGTTTAGGQSTSSGSSSPTSTRPATTTMAVSGLSYVTAVLLVALHLMLF